MIHEIGKNDYGVYSLVLSFLSYFLLDFGLGSTISRFIAKYRADNDDEGISRMFSITTAVYLTIDIVVFVVLAILYFFLSDIFVKLTPDEIETFRHAYIIATFFSICNFFFQPYTGAMMAYEFFVPLKMFDLSQRVGTVLLISLCINIFYSKKLHLGVVSFFKECHLKIVPVLFAAFAVLWGAEHYFNIDTWLNLISIGGAYFVLMTLMLYFMAFNTEEKDMFRNMLVKIKMK